MSTSPLFVSWERRTPSFWGVDAPGKLGCGEGADGTPPPQGPGPREKDRDPPVRGVVSTTDMPKGLSPFLGPLESLHLQSLKLGSRRVKNSHFPVEFMLSLVQKQIKPWNLCSGPQHSSRESRTVPPRRLHTRAEGVDALPTCAGHRPGEGRRAPWAACGSWLPSLS